MELKGHKFTPYLLTVLCDTLVHTANLANQTLVIEDYTISHFCQGSYIINARLVKTLDLLEILQGLEYLNTCFVYKDIIVRVKHGRIDSSIRIYQNTERRDIIPNVTRWFANDREKEKEILVEVYRKGLGL